MRVLWSSQAKADILAILAYIAEERPEAARRMAERIRASMRGAGDHPFLGRAVPELDVANIRERIVPPYRVLYQVRKADIVVLAVVHSRRQLVQDPEER